MERNLIRLHGEKDIKKNKPFVAIQNSRNHILPGIDASIAVTILMIFVPLITTIISNTINVKEKINRKVIATNLAIQAIESVKQISALDEGVISNQVVFDGKKGVH